MDESRGETRNHIQVGRTGVDESGKYVGTVHALAIGENLLQILAAVQHETQCFYSSVTCHIMEVDHSYLILFHKLNHVCFGEIFRVFLQKGNQRIHAHCCTFFHIVDVLKL